MSRCARLVTACTVIAGCLTATIPRSIIAAPAPKADCKPLVTISGGEVQCFAPVHAADAARRLKSAVNPTSAVHHLSRLGLSQVLLFLPLDPKSHAPVPRAILYLYGSPVPRSAPACPTRQTARFILVVESMGTNAPVLPRAMCGWQARIPLPYAHLTTAIFSDGPAAAAVKLAKALRDLDINGHQPPATATATTTATETATVGPGNTTVPVVKIADRGTTLNLSVGDRFLLDLGVGFNWSVSFDPPHIVSRDDSASPPANTQGYYVATATGTTTLTAVGEPTCRSAVPPCARPTILFRLQIRVH